MSWSITASGQSPDRTCEGWLLHRLTEILSGNEAGLRELRIGTEHFGDLGLDDLRHTPEGVDESDESE